MNRKTTTKQYSKICIQYVIMHVETVNIKFLNDIVWSIEVGDNLGDTVDTKRKAK